jgi:hypothetical protein
MPLAREQLLHVSAGRTVAAAAKRGDGQWAHISGNQVEVLYKCVASDCRGGRRAATRLAREGLGEIVRQR